MTTYTIKPLAWANGVFCENSATSFGRYEIDEYAQGDCGASFYFGTSNYCVSVGRGFLSRDEIKAACADHWEGMIKQALEVCDD
jgi:hypothetical protein